MKNIILISVSLLVSVVCVAQPKFSRENEQRAAEIVSQMTLQEKAEYV